MAWAMLSIELPWPPASLSGHNEGHWRGKSAIVAKHRAWAAKAVPRAARDLLDPIGDIEIHFAFYPPDNRSDRMNFANRIKPYADGIAQALDVNDKRFLPSYSFHDPVKVGKVVVSL